MMLRLALLLLVACQDSPKAVTDHDGDGVEDTDDCDPWNGAVSSDSPEICDDLDNDCDGLSDEDDPDLPVQGYVDADEDGYAGTASRSCRTHRQPGRL